MEVRLAQHGPTLVLWNLPQDLLPRGCPEAVPRLPLESAYCLKVRLDFASRLKPSWESASGRASQMFEKFGEENGCFHFTFSRFFDDEAAQPRGGSWNLESAIVLEPLARAMSVTTRAGSADATSPDVRQLMRVYPDARMALCTTKERVEQ